MDGANYQGASGVLQFKRVPARRVLVRAGGAGGGAAQRSAPGRQSFDELKENNLIVCGTPDTVLEKLNYLHEQLGFDHLIMYGQESSISHEAAMANIGLFDKGVYRCSRIGENPDIMPLKG